MNYYSIEFFKQHLKELRSSVRHAKKLYSKAQYLDNISSKIDVLLEYVKDRETSNKDAYSTKHLKSLNFID